MAEISVRERLPRDLLWILAAACVGFSVLTVVLFGIGYDSHAYWLAWQSDEMYGRAPNTQDAFLYSPAFAQVIWPLAQLPWPVFAAVFVVLPAVAFAWLLSPLPWRLAVPIWLMTLPEVVTGNVYWLLAVAAALGLRHPSWWAAVALTKITPCLGPVWFLARREWRPLLWSIGATAGLLALSALGSPDAWREWVAFLTTHASAAGAPLGSPILPPLAVRLPVALVLVVYAARTDRTWLIPVAMVLATPVIAVASFTILAAIPRLTASTQTGSGLDRADRIRRSPDSRVGAD